MAVIRDRITVIPPEGETVAVDILASGVSLGTAHAERSTTRTLTLPASISERTSFFVPRDGTYSVSVKLAGVEIAGPGVPVTVSSFPAEVRVSVDASETADVVTAEGGGSGGSPTPGVAIVRAFPFAFDTAGLVTGHTVYTPTIGDVLLDAWFQVDVAFDGTTPSADVGAFLPSDSGYGYFGQANNPVNMSLADNVDPIGGLASGWRFTGLAQVSGYSNWPPTSGNGRTVPGRFATADPIKVVVSQDGKNTGADPGATQGSATLYLVTSTPATT